MKSSELIEYNKKNIFLENIIYRFFFFFFFFFWDIAQQYREKFIYILVAVTALSMFFSYIT